MKSGVSHIVLLIGLVLLLALSSCSKKCQVNGCRVRMEHRHSGEKFKSKVRPWYAFQNPRVGRDYKRDKSPDKIPWDGPDLEGAEGKDMLVSNDTSALGEDDFMTDDFYEGDSLGGNDYVSEEDDLNTNKKKRKRRKGEEEEEVKKEPVGDPWNIENIKEDDAVISKPVKVKEDTKKSDEDTSELKEIEDVKEDTGEKKKSKKEIAEERKKAREELLKKQLEEEEEEDDDWGF